MSTEYDGLRQQMFAWEALRYGEHSSRKIADQSGKPQHHAGDTLGEHVHALTVAAISHRLDVEAGFSW